MALIVVLAFTVLVTGMVIAFFSRASTMRRVAASSCQQGQADDLAQSALAIVVGSLKQEIANGSTRETVGGCTLYISSSNAYMVPQRNVSTASISAIPGLLRISSRTAPAFPGVEPFPASAVSSTATSANGRSISPTRWNRHYLIPRPATATGSAVPVPDSSFVAPSWVYVTDNGPTVLSAPSRAAIGRYAYAVYDQSGLLDLNVAGYPSTASAAAIAQKGPLAFANLSASGFGLSGSMVTNIVGWRNYATAQASGTSIRTLRVGNATGYCQAMIGATSGFMEVGGATYGGRTDQAFLSRQELLDLWPEYNSAWDQDTLKNLGTFSRAVTAPSMFHDKRFLNGGLLRHYRDDGTYISGSVAQGEPLLYSRFSLKKLGWIAQSGTVCQTSEPLQACFGIKCSISREGVFNFTYIGPVGDTPASIKKLDEVAGETNPREPNFFELLKAGVTGSSIDPAGKATWIPLPDEQVLKTGSNIIQKYLSNNNACQSLGGLGYVSDFWSSSYNYAPLLDLFSAVDEPRVAAGKINPNLARNMTFYTLLSKASPNEDNTNPFSDNTALSLAASLKTKLGTPIADSSGLFAAVSSLGNRQGVLNALASVSNTRTWNLLIDVVAQTGVFPPGAASLERFTVQSERRYWLHVAIDRLTGEVVDQLLEPVYE